MDWCEALFHQRALATVTPEQAAKLADMYEARGEIADQYQREAEASGNMLRRILANRYNGDKVLGMLYRLKAKETNHE
jgi:hypothetical protein